MSPLFPFTVPGCAGPDPLPFHFRIVPGRAGIAPRTAAPGGAPRGSLPRSLRTDHIAPPQDDAAPHPLGPGNPGYGPIWRPTPSLLPALEPRPGDLRGARAPPDAPRPSGAGAARSPGALAGSRPLRRPAVLAPEDLQFSHCVPWCPPEPRFSRPRERVARTPPNHHLLRSRLCGRAPHGSAVGAASPVPSCEGSWLRGPGRPPNRALTGEKRPMDWQPARRMASTPSSSSRHDRSGRRNTFPVRLPRKSPLLRGGEGEGEGAKTRTVPAT